MGLCNDVGNDFGNDFGKNLAMLKSNQESQLGNELETLVEYVHFFYQESEC